MGVKLRKRLFAVVMTLVMVLSMSSFVFAAGEASPEGGDNDPAAVTALDTTVSGTTVKVTWKANDAAKKFRVAYKLTGGSWVRKDTTSKSFSFTAKAGKTYQIAVAAQNGAGKWSKYKYNSTWSYRFIGKASPKATAKKGKVTVKWSKTSGASGYDVRYGYSGGKMTTKSVKGTSKTFSAKAKGKTVVYQVRPYKTVSGKKYVGAWSAKKSIKAK